MRRLLMLVVLGTVLGCQSHPKRDPSDRDGIIRDEERQERRQARIETGLGLVLWALLGCPSDAKAEADEQQAKLDADRMDAEQNDPDRFRKIRGL